MIYVSAFIMLETRNAIIASVLFYLSLVCSTILYEVMRYAPDFVLNNLYPAIKNICFAQPIYILMVLGIAVLKEQIIEVNTEATDMTIAATTDYLTGISNRRFAAQSLDNFLNLAKIDNLTLTIFVVDIDHFKKINDSYGHDIGDRVLINIANFLRHNLRDSDLLGRWGGEEFILILQKTDLRTACNLAERLYKQNSQLIHEQVGQVTFSIGIATSKADDTTDSLFKRTDAALYKAKQTGRNHFKVDEQLEQQK
jgi:diguanylate cyclase (GGDEF)-like protein